MRSEAIREGLLAVVAEHGADGASAMHSNREGGEPRPKGPTVGKAKPVITFGWKERRETL